MDMEKHQHSIEYHQITDQIYLGTNYCCAMGFDEILLKEGIIADISLESEKIDQPWGVKYFLWLPTIDHTAPTLDALAMGSQMIAFLVQRDMKVYVHCKNGHGRAPTLVVAYLMTQGMKMDKAIKLVAKKRPEIHIEPAQKAKLKEFAKQVSWD